jgi:hypothetical protein
MEDFTASSFLQLLYEGKSEPFKVSKDPVILLLSGLILRLLEILMAACVCKYYCSTVASRVHQTTLWNAIQYWEDVAASGFSLIQGFYSLRVSM